MIEKLAMFPHAKPDISSLELTERYIQMRAYQLYERRGRQDGYDQEDWFEAEAEIFGSRHKLWAVSDERGEQAAQAAA